MSVRKRERARQRLQEAGKWKTDRFADYGRGNAIAAAAAAGGAEFLRRKQNNGAAALVAPPPLAMPPNGAVLNRALFRYLK